MWRSETRFGRRRRGRNGRMGSGCGRHEAKRPTATYAARATRRCATKRAETMMGACACEAGSARGKGREARGRGEEAYRFIRLHRRLALPRRHVPRDEAIAIVAREERRLLLGEPHAKHLRAAHARDRTHHHPSAAHPTDLRGRRRIHASKWECRAGSHSAPTHVGGVKDVEKRETLWETEARQEWANGNRVRPTRGAKTDRHQRSPCDT